MADGGLEDLKLRFRARCADDLARLAACEGRPAGELIQRVHRMAGLAGALGFAELSVLAGGIDDAHAAGEAPDADQWRRLLEELARVAQAG